MEANPSINKQDLLTKFLDEIEKPEHHDTYRRAALKYAFDNAYTSITSEIPLGSAAGITATKIRAAMKSDAKQKTSKAVNEAIDHRAQVIVLDLIQANGKPLGDCRGTECIKFGGWLAEIGKRVGKQRVRDVLSEGEARKLWLTRRSR
jgi:hypothetical protein